MNTKCFTFIFLCFFSCLCVGKNFCNEDKEKVLQEYRVFFPLREREEIDPKIQFIRYLQEKGGKWYQLGMESKAKKYAWWSENILNGKVWRINVNKTMNREEEEIVKEALFSYYSRFSVRDQLEGSPNKKAISLIREEVKIIKQNPTENYRRSSDAFKKALIEAYFGIGRGSKLYNREQVHNLLETDNDISILKRCYNFLVNEGYSKDFWFKKLSFEEAPGNRNDGIYRFGLSHHHSFIAKVERLSPRVLELYNSHPEVDFICWPLSCSALNKEFSNRVPDRGFCRGANYPHYLTIMEEAPGIRLDKIYNKGLFYFSNVLKAVSKGLATLSSEKLYYNDTNLGMGTIKYDERSEVWKFYGFDTESIYKIQSSDSLQGIYGNIIHLLNELSGKRLWANNDSRNIKFFNSLLKTNISQDDLGWCSNPPPEENQLTPEVICEFLDTLSGKKTTEKHNYFNVLRDFIKTIGGGGIGYAKEYLRERLIQEEQLEDECGYPEKTVKAARELACFMVENNFEYSKKKFIFEARKIMEHHKAFFNFNTLSFLIGWILTKQL